MGRPEGVPIGLIGTPSARDQAPGRLFFLYLNFY